METKRSDNRRRRVLYDESVQQPTVDPDGQGSAGKRRRSNYAAKILHQFKLSDLVPIRRLFWSLIVAGSIATIGLVYFLDTLTNHPQVALQSEITATLAIESSTSLASWLVSTSYLLASAASLLIFSIRRHRRDDYRGTYRIWSVLAVICLLASLQSQVPLIQILEAKFAAALSSNFLAPGRWGNIALKLTIVAAIAARTIIEVRFSRIALTIVTLTAILFSVSLALQLPAVRGYDWLKQLLFLEPLLPLCCALALLNGTISYARFVWLDANGMVRQRVRRKKKKRARRVKSRPNRVRSTPEVTTRTEVTAASATESQKKPASGPTTVAPAQSSSPSRSAERTGPLRSRLPSSAPPVKPPVEESWQDEDDEDDDSSPVSKAERRRLRKLQRRQRHAA